MKDAQFRALATLLRLRPGAAREAARLVLVDGLRVTDAQSKTGASQQSVTNSLARCRRGLALVHVVVTGHDPTDYHETFTPSAELAGGSVDVRANFLTTKPFKNRPGGAWEAGVGQKWY